jgi:hypothetical protein
MNINLITALPVKFSSLKLLQSIFMFWVLFLGFLNVNTPKSVAQQPQKPPYFCSKLNEEWHTFKRRDRQAPYNFMTWRTWDLGKSPYERCMEVTSRFNSFQARRQLSTLVSGVHRNLPVVCVGWCADGRILYTVPGGSGTNSAALAARSLAELRSIVTQGFGTGRIFNADQLDFDADTGNYLVTKSNGDRVLLMETTPDGDGIVHFDRLMCEIDPEDSNCP